MVERIFEVTADNRNSGRERHHKRMHLTSDAGKLAKKNSEQSAQRYEAEGGCDKLQLNVLSARKENEHVARISKLDGKV
jgi:hypothetical protein